MRMSRALATAGLLAAIGGCAALVVGYAAAQPAGHGSDASKTAARTTAQVPATQSTALEELVPTPTPTPTRTATPRPRSTHPATSPHQAQPPSTPASRPPSTTHAASPRPAPKPSTEPAPRRGQSLPLAFGTGTATRVITVVASSSRSTSALLQAWYKAPGGGWLRYGSTVTAHVGSQGLTEHPSESLSATPIGSFGLTQAFGRASDPGTPLPYFRTGSSDWWVSDASSRYYNTHYRCASSCPFDTGAGENLYSAGFVYTYAVVIDYNRFPVTPGAGSAFFLHVTDGGPTAGCVSISQAKLVSLMRWLGPGTHPRILIGVS